MKDQARKNGENCEEHLSWYGIIDNVYVRATILDLIKYERDAESFSWRVEHEKVGNDIEQYEKFSFVNSAH